MTESRMDNFGLEIFLGKENNGILAQVMDILDNLREGY